MVGGLAARSSQAELLGNVGVFEKELAAPYVVFLIERAAGDEDSDGHEKITKGKAKLASLRRRCNLGEECLD